MCDWKDMEDPVLYPLGLTSNYNQLQRPLPPGVPVDDTLQKQ